VTSKFLAVLAGVACAAGFIPAALAGVEDSGPNGFTVSETAQITAPPDKVYSAVVAPSHWWSSEHTYSQNAANLSLEPRAGGCWCEALPSGGSVQHLVVVNAIPGKLLRMRGALGPLQGMAVDGAMTLSLRAAGTGTELTLRYAVGGYSRDGFGDLAKAVDSVLDGQSARLKRLIETGSPDSIGPHKQGD
jgi:uncharacterized protein YndB with AHSA1/START domain